MSNNQNNSITDYFNHTSAITIIKNGEKFSFLKGDDKFQSLLSSLIIVTKNSQDMPAFGVSLDNETKSKLLSGTWIELEFNETNFFNQMPFDALLIEVDETYQGINIIRKNNGTYDGRCFYLNLKNNMSELSITIKKLTK